MRRCPPFRKRAHRMPARRPLSPSHCSCWCQAARWGWISSALRAGCDGLLAAASETDGVRAAGGAAQNFARGRDIPGEWWNLFRSRALRSLVQQAIINDPDCRQPRRHCVSRARMPRSRGAHSTRRSMPGFGDAAAAAGGHQRRCARALDLQCIHRPGERVLCARRFRRQLARRRVARRASGDRRDFNSRRRISP